MTLNEAIKHLKETLENKTDWTCEECKKEHEQLLNWLELLEQHKKLEEKQGIDLITLFKALENGIWINYHNKIFFINKTNLTVKEFNFNVDIGGVEILFIPYNEFGKTWALRKEDLE